MDLSNGGIIYLSAEEEEARIIAQANAPIKENGDFVNQKVKARFNPKDVEAQTMVPAEKIYELAEVWAKASIKGKKEGTGGVLSYWGIGYNQHIHGQNNTVSLVNLMVLTGNIGRPG